MSKLRLLAYLIKAVLHRKHVSYTIISIEAIRVLSITTFESLIRLIRLLLSF